MRTIAIILSATVLFASCNQREKELEKQLAELQEKTAQKDEDIDMFIETMTEIQLNLDSIKQLEGIVTTRAINNVENPATAEDAILDDMFAIYESMKRTRDRIEELEKQMQQSSINSQKMQQLVAKLKKDIEQKDAEIIQLKEALAEANIYIDKLMSSVDRLALENERRIKVIQEKNAELQAKEDEIQTAYYATGSTKELRERNIIDKEGAFLGMGGVKVISEDLDLSQLEKINIQEVTEIPLSGKNPELITPHPKHSYEFVKGAKKQVEKLVIDDPEAFWQNSKVLVVVTN